MVFHIITVTEGHQTPFTERETSVFEWHAWNSMSYSFHWNVSKNSFY